MRPFTTHGHPTGTPVPDGATRPMWAFRCGGPIGGCDRCAREALAAAAAQAEQDG